MGVCDVLEVMYKFPCPTCDGNCVLPTDALAPCRKCKGKGVFSSDGAPSHAGRVCPGD